MPDVPSSNHKAPYRLGELFAPGLMGPGRWWIGFALFYAAVCLMGGIQSVLPGGSASQFGAWMVGGLMAARAMMFLFDFCRSFFDPEAARLGETEDGRALLSEGQCLHDQRTKMTEGSAVPHPLLEAFCVPTSVDETTEDVIRRRTEINRRFWDYQTALERDLRDRQERHLRGERVAIIGNLSDRTP